MVSAEVIEKLVKGVFVQRRHVQPHYGCKNADVSVVYIVAQAESSQNAATIVVDGWHHNLAPYPITIVTTVKQVHVNRAVIKSQVVVQLGKIVMEVSKIYRPAKILSPIQQGESSVRFKYVLKYEVAMKQSWCFRY